MKTLKRGESPCAFAGVVLLFLLGGLCIAHAEDVVAVSLTFNQKGNWYSKNAAYTDMRLSYPDQPDLVVQFPCRPLAEAKAALASYRPVIKEPLFTIRPEATKEEVATALAEARKMLARMPTGNKSNGYLYEHLTEVACLQRILMSVGSVEDTEALVAYCVRDHEFPSQIGLRMLPVVAAIEARLGLLEQGQLKGLLASAEPNLRCLAACLLHVHGSSLGDTVLFEVLQAPEKGGICGEYVPAVLLDRDDPVVLAGMRAHFDRARATWHAIQPKIKAREPSTYDCVQAPEGVLPYLLVYGTAEDRRQLAAVKWMPDMIPQIACLAQDPSLLVPAITAVEDLHGTIGPLTRMASVLWSYDAETRDRLFRRFGTLAYCEALESAKVTRNLPAEQHAQWAELQFKKKFSPWMSFVVPTSGLGFYIDAQLFDDSTSGSSWIPARSEYLPGLLSHLFHNQLFRMGKSHYAQPQEVTLRKLDHVPTLQVAQELEKVAAPAEVKALFLASHRVSSGRFLLHLDRYEDGVERRPYWLVKEGQGLLSGVLQATPKVRGNTLTVSLSVDQTKAICRTMIEVGPDDEFPIGQYAMNHGRKLVKGVRLFRNGQSTNIEMTGPDEQGLFTGSLALEKPSLDGVRLVVDFEFFDEKIPVVMDLFAGGVAKQLRRAAVKGYAPVAVKTEVPRTDVAPVAEISYVKVLGLPLADALKTLKDHGLPTDGEEIDILGARVFTGKGTGIEFNLNEAGRVIKVVLHALAKSKAGRYDGPVHAGLTSAATRDQVIAKLGKPAMTTADSQGSLDYKYLLIGYELPACHLRFAFTRQEQALAQVSFEIKEGAAEDE